MEQNNLNLIATRASQQTLVRLAWDGSSNKRGVNVQCTAITPICCYDGWDIVLAGGRFNVPAETRYAPIEGEALAIAVALENSRY